MARSFVTDRWVDTPAAAGLPAWLRVIEGRAPILFLAPHGGRAEPNRRFLTYPRVNDLYTDEIAIELAHRLGASALVNCALDRNRLDLNRLDQVMCHAPWFVELLADRVQAIVERRQRATLVLLHGWNVVDPRLDLGVGLKMRQGCLYTPAGSFRCASEAFIAGPLRQLSELLETGKIAVTFGLRYPAADANNLAQIFTPRHESHGSSALARLAKLSAAGGIDAVQMELSATLRLPGRMRKQYIDATVQTFSEIEMATVPAIGQVSHSGSGISCADPPAKPTLPDPAGPASRGSLAPASDAFFMPLRYGVEFFDANAMVGAMASFDVGRSGAVARTIFMLGDGTVLLFTSQTVPAPVAGGLALGPLSLRISRHNLHVDFEGPMLAVADGRAYVDLESALASASVCENVRLQCEVQLIETVEDGVGERPPRAPWPSALAPGFGGLAGELRFGNRRLALKAGARLGDPLSVLGSASFVSRRRFWTISDANAWGPSIVRAETIESGSLGVPRSSLCEIGRSMRRSGRISHFEPAAEAAGRALSSLKVALRFDGGRPEVLDGVPAAVLCLSRPTLRGRRFRTTLGFAAFQRASGCSYGMFEYSRRVEPPGALRSTRY